MSADEVAVEERERDPFHDEVRDWWATVEDVQGRDGSLDTSKRAANEAEFDDWLRDHDAALTAKAKAEERERIAQECRRRSDMASVRELKDPNAYLRRTVWDAAERVARTQP